MEAKKSGNTIANNLVRKKTLRIFKVWMGLSGADSNRPFEK
jgi:hypothetical protein